MHNFVYTAQPARVIFGTGTASKVGDEVRRLAQSFVDQLYQIKLGRHLCSPFRWCIP